MQAVELKCSLGKASAQLSAALLMGRPITSILIGASTLAIFLFGTDASLSFAFVGSSAMLISGLFAFLVDDVIGYEADRSGGRSDKLLVSGRANMLAAKSWLPPLFVLSVFLSSQLCSKAMVASILINTILVIYPYFSERYPYLKIIFVAIMCAAPAYYVNSALEDPVVPLWAISIAIFFFFFRELAIDVTQAEFDKKAGRRTLPVLMRLPDFASVAWFGLILSYCALFFYVVKTGAVVALIGLIALLACFWVGRKRQGLGLSLSRAPILLGVVSSVV